MSEDAVLNLKLETQLHGDFLHRKIETARAERLSGLTIPDAEIEAEFAARRAELLRKPD